MKIEKYIIGVITLIAIGAIGTAIYFGLNNNDSSNTGNNITENENDNVGNDSEDKAFNDFDSITTIDIDKVKVNKILYKELYRPLAKIPKNKYNINLLDSRKNKVIFMWEVINQNLSNIDKEDVIDEKTIDGEEVTGARAYSELLVLNTYKQLYGESITLNEILSSNSELKYKDGYIYGRKVTGWGAPDYLLKATNLIYNSQTNLYEMTIDCITQSSNDGYTDYDFIEKYGEYNIIEYPNDAVFAKLKITYDDNHVLKSLVFEK